MQGLEDSRAASFVVRTAIQNGLLFVEQHAAARTAGSGETYIGYRDKCAREY